MMRIKTMKKIYLTFCFVFLSLLLPLHSLADSMNEDARKIEAYLNGLDTLKARFVQIAHNGSEAQGTFYLDRPGKLRFEYDEPIDDFIVADGLFIYYYDAEMKQQSNTRIGNSLADFLLRENITLGGDITVREIKRAGGFLQTALVMTEDPGAGELSLAFREAKDGSLKLDRWRVTDSQNMITEVVLEDVETDIELSRKLFFYSDTERSKPQYN